MRIIDADNFKKNLRLYLDRSFLGETSSQSSITIGELASLIEDEPTVIDDKTLKCEGCKHEHIKENDAFNCDCVHCSRSYSDCYEKVLTEQTVYEWR